MPSSVLLVAHLLTKFLEMRGDFSDLRLALQGELGREFWKGLVLANISYAKKLALNCISR